MILVDANLLIYAQNADFPQHRRAVRWWDAQLSGGERTGLCWQVVSSFLRICTNARLFSRPLSTEEASECVDRWLAQPNIAMLVPTSRHWPTFHRQLTSTNAQADLVMDARLAALALEHDCALYSTDSDFARFPEVRWVNPLA